MMKNNYIVIVLVLTILVGCAKSARSDTGSHVVIVCNDLSSPLQALAAKEIRRYVYLRTGELLVIKDRMRPKGNAISIAVDNSLGEQAYKLKSISKGDRTVLHITGGSDVAVLYGAYRFAETLGVRFYLHGDTIPDGKVALNLEGIDEVGKPLFSLRGIQPFHNFPVGPTLWDCDNYMAIIGQLPKMRMNFIGFHSYSKILPWREYPAPELWWGLKEDINPDGTVKFSSGSAHDAYTLSGMHANGTDRYSYGASDLFSRNLYASDLYERFMPFAKTDEDRNAVYNQSGKLLNNAFTFANSLGVKTCMGNELKMPLPDRVVDKLEEQGKDPSDPKVLQELYEGVFERIKRTHPLDYYWFWTQEEWTWNRVEPKVVEATVTELKVAMQAAENVDASFTLGTCGWVLGPPHDPELFDSILDKEMFVSCINRNLGADPVDPAFDEIQGRPKWAIPWIENDLSMNSPQLWVGRIRKDAVDARNYGCTGLFGIHWRTRIIGPTISALAQAAWNQDWALEATVDADVQKHPVTVDGGNVVRFSQTIKGTTFQTVFQTVRYGDMTYRIELPNKEYRVIFQMVEPTYNESKRLFSVELGGETVIDKLDIFAKVGKDTALEQSVEHVRVVNGSMEIKFVSHFDHACIAGIVIEEYAEKLGPDDQPVLIQINCGGSDGQGYISDTRISKKAPRYLATDDFYLDWAEHQFGAECAKEIADIFVRIDGHLPVVSTWGPGPGGIKPKPFDKNLFKFIDELAALQKQIKGAGNRDRFVYWLNEFRYMRSMARVAGLHHMLSGVMAKVEDEKKPADRIRIAREEALPLRQSLVEEWGEMLTTKLSTITTTGGMGDIINLEEENRLQQSILDFSDKRLSQVLRKEVPQIPQDYRGPARIFVPAIRTSLLKGESLQLKVLVLGCKQPASVTLHWRALGTGEWKQTAVKHDARSIYRVKLPSELIGDDFEYYLSAITDSGSKLRFPVTAPALNNTVVIMPK